MQDAPFKGALEPFLVTVLPFLVDDPECTVLIWRPSMYPIEAHYLSQSSTHRTHHANVRAI